MYTLNMFILLSCIFVLHVSHCFILLFQQSLLGHENVYLSKLITMTPNSVIKMHRIPRLAQSCAAIVFQMRRRKKSLLKMMMTKVVLG